jgi:hypothetical protein
MVASSSPSAAPLLVEAGIVLATGFVMLIRHAIVRATRAYGAQRHGRPVTARRAVRRV